MCHGVLVLIENITKDSKLLQRDLWEDILKFFLAINDVVLSPPSIKGSLFKAFKFKKNSSANIFFFLIINKMIMVTYLARE